MCMDALQSAQDDAPPVTPASVLNAGTTAAAGTIPPRQSGISKGVNNPVTQGAAGVAGAALAPATGGLSLLIPVAAKLIGSLLGKKPAPNFGASMNAGG